ncbi:MAG: MG2 domain-containing protein, partial [Planctomycetota bacterium]
MIDRNDRVRARVQTDADGVARFDVTNLGDGSTDPSSDPWRAFLLIARRGDDVRGLIVDGVDRVESRQLLTTDRPLYRPGDTVHFKVVTRNRDRGELVLPDDAGCTVTWKSGAYGDTILGTFHGEGTPHGTAHGSFTLPPETRTGDHRLQVDGVDCRFRVEPYRKPELLVSVERDTDAATPTVVVHARYAFGGPVAGAQVVYTVSRDHEEFTPPAPSFPFIPFEDAYFEVYDFRPLLKSGRLDEITAFGLEWLKSLAIEDLYVRDSAEPVLESTGTTDAEGKLRVPLPPVESAHRWFFVDGIVTDSSRYAVPFQQSIEVSEGPGTITAGLGQLFAIVGEPVTAYARVHDHGGAAVAGAKVEFAVLAPRVDASDDREWEWVDGGVTTTDDRGLAEIVVTPDADGERSRVELEGSLVDWIEYPLEYDFRLRVRRLDDSGSGRPAPVRLPVRALDLERLPDPDASGEDEIHLQPERWVVPEGEPVRLAIESTFVGEGWLVVSGGSFEVLQRVRFDTAAQVVEFPYRDEWGPSVHVGVISLSLGYPIEAYRAIFRDPSARSIDVDLTFDRESYRPGETARLRVATSLEEAGAVPCELEIGIVDETIYQLREATVFHPALAFRSPERIEGQSASNWSGARFRTISDGTEIAFGGSFFDLGDDEDGAEDAGPRARESFSDTWYWTATAETGVDGTLELELPVPDDLTEWRVVARAVSGADRFGFAVSETKTRQPVVVRWVIPSPLRKGDAPTVALIAHHHGAITGTFDLEWALEGPVANSEGKRRGKSEFTIDAGGHVRLDLPLVCTGSGEATFDATLVRSGTPRKPFDPDAGDRQRLTRTVDSGAAPRLDSSHGRLRNPWSAQWELPADHVAGSAAVSVQLSTNPLDEVAGVLPSLVRYPYGCVEQTMSRFLPALIARHAATRTVRAIELPDDLDAILRAGIDRLIHFQHDDGGWGWWTDDETDLGMTRYVLAGLLHADALGVRVEPGVILRGLEFLFGGLDERSISPEELALLQRAKAGGWLRDRDLDANPHYWDFAFAWLGETFEAEVERWRSDREGRAALTGSDPAYLVLAGVESDGVELIGALPEPGYRGIAEVALRLRALARIDPAHPFLPKLIEFLLAHRKAGGWNTTLDTAYVVHALAS